MEYNKCVEIKNFVCAVLEDSNFLVRSILTEISG